MIFGSFKKNKPEIVLDINLSYICNLKCKFCMTKTLRERETSFLSWEFASDVLKKILDKILLDYNITKIILLGGEPTILPYLENLILFLSNWTNEIGVNTNGLIFSNENIVIKLKKAGLKFVNMSVHHYKDEVIDFLAGAKGVGVKQKKAIDFLKGNGIKVSLNCVIQKYNYNILDKYFLYYYKKFDIKSVGFNFIQLEGYALDWLEKVKINYSDVNFKKYVKFFKIMQQVDRGIVVKFSEVPFCVAGVNMFDYNKFFIDKEYILKGRIGYRENTDNIVFELQSDIRKTVKIQDDYCKNCFLFNECEGFWKRNYDILKEDIFYMRYKK